MLRTTRVRAQVRAPTLLASWLGSPGAFGCHSSRLLRASKLSAALWSKTSARCLAFSSGHTSTEDSVPSGSIRTTCHPKALASYRSRFILQICAGNRQFSSPELCHNQTGLLPERPGLFQSLDRAQKPPRIPHSPAASLESWRAHQRRGASVSRPKCRVPTFNAHGAKLGHDASQGRWPMSETAVWEPGAGRTVRDRGVAAGAANNGRQLRQVPQRPLERRGNGSLPTSTQMLPTACVRAAR
jgi:hypothetical protein